MASIADVLKRVEEAEPRRRSVTVPLDPAAVDRLAELEQAVKDARRNSGSIADADEVGTAQSELDAYRREIADTVVTFTFRELKRPEWNSLLAAHPSTDYRYRWNPDTFEPALVAVSCVDPQMDVDDALRLFGNLGGAAAKELVDCAYGLQEVMGRVPFGGSGTGGMNDSEPNSTTAPPEESDTASS